jgi:hypothetical protein
MTVSGPIKRADAIDIGGSVQVFNLDDGILKDKHTDLCRQHREQRTLSLWMRVTRLDIGESSARCSALALAMIAFLGTSRHSA